MPVGKPSSSKNAEYSVSLPQHCQSVRAPVDSELNAKHRQSMSFGEPSTSHRIGALVSAVWLVLMVASFVVVQLSRMPLPIVQWPSKLMGLLGR